jgi:hypothetical protein
VGNDQKYTIEVVDPHHKVCEEHDVMCIYLSRMGEMERKFSKNKVIYER